MVKHVDVSDNADLLSLAEEVARSGDSIVLSKGATELATITPTSNRTKLKPKNLSPSELEAFNSSAGSWADVDVDAFMKYVYEGRQSSKPRVDL